MRSQGFRKENTLIIEDTQQNCRYNYGNAIYVHDYDDMIRDTRGVNGKMGDNDLDILIHYLQSLRGVRNVRCIEKRWWRQTVCT